MEMNNPFPQHPEMEHEPITHLGGVGLSKYSEGKAARKDINDWLENMTPEEKQQLHEYNLQLKKDREHGDFY